MRYGAIGLFALLSACTTLISEAGGVVLVSDGNTLASCQKLGQVHSRSLLSGIGASGIAYNNALTELKNEAADRGASHVMLVDTSSSLRVTKMIGDAYRC
jgi:Domain of unknown function (DUF4156)